MKPALSFEAQPNFARLVSRVQNLQESRERLTVVCGAGVSADAGLPGWSALIDRMCDGASLENFSQLVRADPTDDRRKVDYIVRMCSQSDRSLVDLIRDALYRDLRPSTGHLAEAVAQLVWNLSTSATLMTTNFDDRLELALRGDGPGTGYVDEVVPYGIETVNDFLEDVPNETRVGVLHLHGMVAAEAILHPVILSESYFLLHGPKIQQILLESITNGPSLFIGVSLADPNLIGPLNRRAQQADSDLAESFVLVAPDPIAGESFERVQHYAQMRARYLAEEFGVYPIVLKSYSQVAQLVFELSAALSNRDSYVSDDAATSTRYGFRLKRHLDFAYESIGSGVGPFNPDMEQAARVSDRLYAEVENEDGLAPWLRHLIGTMPEYHLKDYGVERAELERENVALFLWLRVRDVDCPELAKPRFAIQLVGTSVYAHREWWSWKKVYEVVPDTEYPAVDAIFHGQAFSHRFDDHRSHPLWKSILAVPLTVGGGDEAPLHIGSITLNSTRTLSQAEKSPSLPDGGTTWSRESYPSAISLLNSAQRLEFMDRIHTAGKNALAFDS